MAHITAQVEDSLKDEASQVLDELGLDIPTIIRMCLKAVVRTNGIPFPATLNTAPMFPGPCCGWNPTMPKEGEQEHTAPEKEKPSGVIDYDTREGRKAIAQLFVKEICEVPSGKVTRWKDLEERLSAQYGVEVKRPGSVRWPATTTNEAGEDVEVPYWRIVGLHGGIHGDRVIEMEEQKKRLASEGHTFYETGHDHFKGVRINGWMKKLVR